MIHRCVGTLTVQNSNNQNKHNYLSPLQVSTTGDRLAQSTSLSLPPNICALFVKKIKIKTRQKFKTFKRMFNFMCNLKLSK